jgi:hypothetical protein
MSTAVKAGGGRGRRSVHEADAQKKASVRLSSRNGGCVSYVAPCGRSVCCAPSIHGLTGLLRKAFYVSPPGYVMIACSLPTQGVALGSPLEPLRGRFEKPDAAVLQHALTPVATLCRPPRRRVRPLRGLGIAVGSFPVRTGSSCRCAAGEAGGRCLAGGCQPSRTRRTVVRMSAGMKGLCRMAPPACSMVRRSSSATARPLHRTILAPGRTDMSR